MTDRSPLAPPFPPDLPAIAGVDAPRRAGAVQDVGPRAT